MLNLTNAQLAKATQIFLADNPALAVSLMTTT